MRHFLCPGRGASRERGGPVGAYFFVRGMGAERPVRFRTASIIGP